MKKFFCLLILVCLSIVNMAGCKSHQKDGKTTPTVADISFLDYAIVRPEKASERLLDEIAEFYGNLKSLSNYSNEYKTDALKKGEKPDSNAKEILIGRTNRPESEEILAQLSNDEYVIAVIGNKIVITGVGDGTTIAALKFFVETYLNQNSAGTLAGDLSYWATVDIAVIVEAGIAKYSLVSNISAHVNEDMLSRLYSIIRSISRATFLTFDDDVAEDPNAFQILVGDTAYQETAVVKKATPPGGYTIDFIGNKIVIFGWTAEAMEKAITEFTDLISNSCYTDANGKTNLSIIKDKISSDKVNKVDYYYENELLSCAGRAVDGMYDTGDNALMLYWANSNEEMFRAYITQLETLGFTKFQSLDNTSVVSATYAKDKTCVHVYYLKRCSELRVITQNNATLPVNSYNYTKVCEPAVTQLGLDYTNEEDIGGMGYLIRLEDGTFVVIDGGGYSDTSYDVDNLYNLMLAQKPAEVENIVIAAWIITHGHIDHCKVYNEFSTSKYASQVTVKALVGNDPSNYTHSIFNEPTHGFPHGEKCKAFPGCVYMKVHTGQQLFFPGITMTILFTPEDVYPGCIPEINSGATIVFDATINKDHTRFMFFADLTNQGSVCMAKMYQEDLKCHVMQVPHHGNGGSLELFKLCNPDIAIWPSSKKYFNADYVRIREQNKWILENVGTIIVSGDGNYTFWFNETMAFDEDIAGSTDEAGKYSKFY